MAVPQKIKWRITVRPSNPTSRCVHKGTESSLNHKSQKLDKAQMFFNRWMDKINVVYTHNGILFSTKTEWNSDTCHSKDETWKHYVKLNKTSTKRTNIWFCLFVVPRIAKFTDIGSRRVVTRGWGERNGSYCLVDTEFQLAMTKIFYRNG